MLSRAVLLLFILAAAGCGFRPLYDSAPGGDTAAALAQIMVPPIAERSGQLLRIELQNRFSRGGRVPEKRFTLRVTISESTGSVAVRRDATATRANLTINASYKLVRHSDNLVLLSGSARSVNSYNILESDFATLAAETDAKRRAARDLATEISSRLAIFLEDAGS